MKSSTFNMKIYYTIVSVVKYREIFQVYNNNYFIAIYMPFFIMLLSSNYLFLFLNRPNKIRAVDFTLWLN